MSYSLTIKTVKGRQVAYCSCTFGQALVGPGFDAWWERHRKMHRAIGQWRRRAAERKHAA